MKLSWHFVKALLALPVGVSGISDEGWKMNVSENSAFSIC